MEKLEAIATSPYFAIVLVLVGTWLFMLLAREFAMWFFRLGHFENELKNINLKLEEISQNISKSSVSPAVSTQKATPSITASLPPIPTAQSVAAAEITKQQFPIQH